jgi:hypothetical protein
MVINLILASPLLLGISFILAAVCRAWGREGVSLWVWLGLILSANLGLLGSVLTVRLTAIGGEHVQERLLGRAYASPLALVAYRETDFPDVSQEWRYRLRPPELALLNRRCTRNRGEPGLCRILDRFDEPSGQYVQVEGGDLVIGMFAL